MLKQIGDAVGIVGRTETGKRIGFDGGMAVEIGCLVKIAQGRRGVAEDRTGLRLDKAGRDLHQRRLARAVAADKTEPLAGFELEAGAGKQRRAAEGEVDVVELEDRRLPQDQTPEKSYGRAITIALPVRRLTATGPSAMLDMVRDEPKGRLKSVSG